MQIQIHKYTNTNTQILHNILEQCWWCDRFNLLNLAFIAITACIQTPDNDAVFHDGWWGWKMIVPINEYVSWLMDGPDPEAVLTYMASVIVVTHCFLWGGFSWDDFLKYKNRPEVPCVDCQWFLTLNQVKLTNPVFGQLSTDDSGIVFSVGNWSCGLSLDLDPSVHIHWGVLVIGFWIWMTQISLKI